jgi:hypothetical protein
MDQRVHSCDPWREVRYLSREKHFRDVAAFTAELLE